MSSESILHSDIEREKQPFIVDIIFAKRYINDTLMIHHEACLETRILDF